MKRQKCASEILKELLDSAIFALVEMESDQETLDAHYDELEELDHAVKQAQDFLAHHAPGTMVFPWNHTEPWWVVEWQPENSGYWIVNSKGENGMVGEDEFTLIPIDKRGV